MKNLKLILTFLLLAFFAFGAIAQGKLKKEKGSKGNKIGNQEITIKTSAQCEMCKERIEKALAFQKGVKKAVLDVDSKNLMVVYNSNQISADQIRATVNKTGYDADDKTAEAEAYKKLPACCQKGGH